MYPIFFLSALATGNDTNHDARTARRVCRVRVEWVWGIDWAATRLHTKNNVEWVERQVNQMKATGKEGKQPPFLLAGQGSCCTSEWTKCDGIWKERGASRRTRNHYGRLPACFAQPTFLAYLESLLMLQMTDFLFFCTIHLPSDEGSVKKFNEYFNVKCM